ncbi:MAG TPA: AraC family transcriptional regulator [Jatrophihabitans sp.]|nr:AraC family transcriptional regulator [Jatrophihabitans sp.]
MGVQELQTLAASDVDDAEDQIGAVYLPTRLRPEQAGPISMQLRAVKLGRVTMGWLRFALDMRILTAPPENYHVDVPLSGHAASRAGGGNEVCTAPGYAAVYMPGAPADLRWSADTHEVCLMLEPTELEDELARLAGQCPKRPLVFAERMDLNSPGGQAWMRVLDVISREAERADGLLDYPLISRRLEQLLIDGLLVSHQHNHSELLTEEPTTVAQRAARRVVEMMQERPHHPWSVSELAQQVSVSARSLHQEFRRLTGTTPMAYLRDIRLQCAYDELRTADPEVATVTTVAHLWGFAHLGRFAASYRQRFGELPGETLKRGS